MQDAGSFTDVHAKVLAMQPTPCDAEIVTELLEMEYVSNDNDNAIESGGELVYCPTKASFANYQDQARILLVFKR